MAQAEELAADYPDARLKHRLAARCGELGWYLYFYRPDEAEGLFRRAISLIGTNSDRPTLAAVYSGLANSYVNTERWTEAEEPLSQALDIWQTLVNEQPAHSGFRCALANTLSNRGAVYENTGRFSEAELAYRAALAIGEELTIDLPTVPGHRASVAYFHRSLGNLLRVRDQAQAAEHIKQALANYERLVAGFPSMPEYREPLLFSYIDTGRVMAAIGRTQEALEALGKAISIQERLEEELSNKLTYWGQLAASHIELGRILADSGRTGEADGEFRNAVVIAEKLEADFAGKPDYRADLAVTQASIGSMLARAGRPTDTVRVFRLAMKHYEELVRDFPNVDLYRLRLAGCHYRIGVALASLGQTRDAQAAYREAIAQGADSCSVWARLAAAQLALGDLDGYRKSCARLLDGFGQNEYWMDANTVAWFCLLIPDSGVDFAKVVQVAEAALTHNDPYAPPSYRHDALNTLGVALYRAGRFQESIARLDEAIAAHAKGGNAWDWLFLAMAHERLGQTAEARKWYDQAREWTEKNRTTMEKRKTLWEELGRFDLEARAVLKVE